MRNFLKKHGRRMAGTWGRPRKGNKRVANKAVRRLLKEQA
jgi:hypothetical protein